MPATPTLKRGDVVLIVPTHHPHRVFRTVFETAATEWRTVDFVQPNPDTKHEYRDPKSSRSWSVYFTDGSWAGATRSSEWATRPEEG